MKDFELDVNIDASLRWKLPPENTAEKCIRDQADKKIAALAMKLNESVKLILIEMAKI